jgi:hypothetical protein
MDKHPQTFSLERYEWLKRLTRMLSRGQRTVQIVNYFLEMILCRSDAASVKKNEKDYFDCIHMKFIIVTDLAISCKLTVA